MNEAIATELPLLIEECAEVQQVACKMLRFGVSHHYPDGVGNIEKLTQECGDLLAIIERLNLDPVKLEAARRAKHERLRTFGPEAWPSPHVVQSVNGGGNG